MIFNGCIDAESITRRELGGGILVVTIHKNGDYRRKSEVNQEAGVAGTGIRRQMDSYHAGTNPMQPKFRKWRGGVEQSPPALPGGDGRDCRRNRTHATIISTPDRYGLVSSLPSCSHERKPISNRTKELGLILKTWRGGVEGHAHDSQVCVLWNSRYQVRPAPLLLPHVITGATNP